MITITIPIKEYKQSIEIQKSILSRLDSLQKVIVENSKDEVSSIYIKRLSKIEKGLSSGKGIKLKNKSEVKKFFHSL
jgi:signal transduction protein with GAF and PtsI domain